jgi:hypothetical protein
MIICALLILNLVVWSDCWKPERAEYDDDLSEILLSASDFCRCANRLTLMNAMGGGQYER